MLPIPAQEQPVCEFGEVTEWPIVRHWKCRVGVKPHRGFESRPLRFLFNSLELRHPVGKCRTRGPMPNNVSTFRSVAGATSAEPNLLVPLLRWNAALGRC